LHRSPRNRKWRYLNAATFLENNGRPDVSRAIDTPARHDADRAGVSHVVAERPR